jgi:hypothetical protein
VMPHFVIEIELVENNSKYRGPNLENAAGDGEDIEEKIF